MYYYIIIFHMYQLLLLSWKNSQSFSNQHSIIENKKQEKNKNNITANDSNTSNILVNKHLINIIDKSIESTERQIISLITCGDVY